MNKNNFPGGWDETRVRKVLAHYDEQSQDEAWLRTKPVLRPPKRS